MKRSIPTRAAGSGPGLSSRGEPSPVMILLVIVATIGVLAYGAFLLDPANRGDLLPYAMVIVAESILVLHALLSMWTILSSGYDPRDFAYYEAAGRLIPDDGDGTPVIDGRRVLVDVFVTVYGENLEVIRRTVTAALAMDGRHETWVLDDGRSDEVRDLAAELGARYVRRLSGNGAKAGNVNHALTLANGKFFAIFDADFAPKPDFLRETLPFFVDRSVAFVQTPQAYENLHTVIARGAAYMQTVFYRFIQPGRNRFNAAFCVGTNVVFRRRAIDGIGGIHTDSKSEDVWTALTLHEHGWRSVFIPDVLAIGEAPETVEAYSKQQLRWATGGFEILLRHNPLSPRRTLTADQRIQYFVTASFYLTGICPLLLLLVPPLEIYLELRPMNLELTVWTWALFYAGFYVMQVLLAWFAVGSFRWETLTLATVSFPIYAKAFWNVLTGKDVGWHVTGSATRRSPFNYVIPQIIFFVFLAFTTVVGVWRDVDNGVFTLATAWNATNTVILGAFLVAVMRENGSLRRRPAGAPAEIVSEPALITVVAQPAPREPVTPAVHEPGPGRSGAPPARELEPVLSGGAGDAGDSADARRSRRAARTGVAQ